MNRQSLQLCYLACMVEIVLVNISSEAFELLIPHSSSIRRKNFEGL